MDEQRIASITTASQTEESLLTSPVRAREGVDAFLADLVRRQCKLVEALGGVIVMRPSREQPQGTSVRYEGDDGKFKISARQFQRLTEIGARAAKDKRGVVDHIGSTEGLLTARPEYQVLAAPLMLGGQPQGASVCIVPHDEAAIVAENLKRLELSTLAFEAFIWKQQVYIEVEAKVQLREALDLLDKSSQGHDTVEMSSLLCHELQRRFGCLRVSIGLIRGHDVRLVAVGGTENLDKRSELAESLEAVMEECADQDIEIRFPQPADAPPSERRVVRAHASLSERFGPAAIASFPLRLEDGLIGVIVMEREPSDPFNDNTLGLLRLIAEYIGPMVWTRRMADRGILAVSRDRIVDLSETMVGPTKTGLKMFLLAAVLLLVASLVIPVRDRALGSGRIASTERRQIAAPFEGRLDQVFVKPGDTVVAGVTPIFALNSREIELQLQSTRSERDRLEIQADDARFRGKTSEVAEFDVRAKALSAEVELYEYQLDRAVVKAPIDGTVTQGLLDDRIGEVVSPGTALMEVADLSSLSAYVFVPETAISRVEVGSKGTLALTARPGDKIPFTVSQVTPAAEVIETRNVYRVEIEMDEVPAWIRPGMEGQGRIFGDRTNLFTVYTRPMFDALRMRLWL